MKGSEISARQRKKEKTPATKKGHLENDASTGEKSPEVEMREKVEECKKGGG